jgi:hypothetical protein
LLEIFKIYGGKIWVLENQRQSITLTLGEIWNLNKDCDIQLTISQIRVYIVYELLDDNGYGTGEIVSVSPDNLEIFRKESILDLNFEHRLN